MWIQCDFCGHNMKDTDQFCQNCGAPNNHLQQYTQDVPRTIEELKEYCEQKKIPVDKMRFFIGEDYKKPKAFGIFEDREGQFVVYKNKANGERAIRYKGPDEAFAVYEIFQKLRSEMAQQQGKTADYSSAAGVRKKTKPPTLKEIWGFGFSEKKKEKIQEETSSEEAAEIRIEPTRSPNYSSDLANPDFQKKRRKKAKKVDKNEPNPAHQQTAEAKDSGSNAGVWFFIGFNVFLVLFCLLLPEREVSDPVEGYYSYQDRYYYYQLDGDWYQWDDEEQVWGLAKRVPSYLKTYSAEYLESEIYLDDCAYTVFRLPEETEEIQALEESPDEESSLKAILIEPDSEEEEEKDSYSRSLTERDDSDYYWGDDTGSDSSSSDWDDYDYTWSFGGYDDSSSYDDYDYDYDYSYDDWDDDYSDFSWSYDSYDSSSTDWDSDW